MLEDRLATIATAVIVSVMFLGIVQIGPALQHWSTLHQIAGSLAGAVLSVGLYRSLAEGLLFVFKRTLWLRRVVLGQSFLEGTWVGHYVAQGEHRFTLEFIDQSAGITIVRGREFDQKGQTRASWSSETVAIDIERMQLVYAYTCKVFSEKHVQEGLGVFSIVSESGRRPNKLDGYAVDLIDGNRDPNVEWKLNDGPMKDDQALSRARELFNVPA